MRARRLDPDVTRFETLRRSARTAVAELLLARLTPGYAVLARTGWINTRR
ncbi:MAG: hypothetical protein IT495_00320 [Gammaproteobacteria bacterium]|nr:hypothetical protein [Gammaproteobacteria bacterium]